MAALYRIWTSVFFLAVVVQVGLAGYGAFHTVKKAEDVGSITKKTVENGWDAHAIFGTIVVIASLLLLAFAFAARRQMSWDPRKLTGILFVLTAIQMVLPELGRKVPALGWLHPIDALAIYALAATLAHRAWTKRDAPAPATVSTA
jgi:hypothetical protein